MAVSPMCACGCGVVVMRRGRTGPAPAYASEHCRVRAFRQRQANAVIVPEVKPVTVRTSGESLDDQVARAILEVRAAGFALQRLGISTRPELAWRCSKLGDAILAALSDSFGETQ